VGPAPGTAGPAAGTAMPKDQNGAKAKKPSGADSVLKMVQVRRRPRAPRLHHPPRCVSTEALRTHRDGRRCPTARRRAAEEEEAEPPRE
jgi:hypothetical protein